MSAGPARRSAALACLVIHALPLRLCREVPAVVAVMERRRCARTRPVVVKELAGQIRVQEREPAPFLDKVHLVDERVPRGRGSETVSYTHLRAHETRHDLV